LISSQWHVLVLTLRLAVYTLFGKARSNLGKNFLHPQNMHSRTLMLQAVAKKRNTVSDNISW